MVGAVVFVFRWSVKEVNGRKVYVFERGWKGLEESGFLGKGGKGLVVGSRLFL